MDLVKRNIHMDRMGKRALSQITLEDDINLAENKPDVDSICLESGHILIDEIKPHTDYVNVRGRLILRVLYHTEEEGSGLEVLEGRLSFDEKINMQGLQSADLVSVSGSLEDLSIGIINSRKLSVQALLTLEAGVEEIYDEEVPIGIHGEEKVEYRQTPLQVAQIAICKNDIYRIKEEITLPAGYPNISQILWNTVTFDDVEFRPLEENLSLQGDLRIFLLYEGEGEEHPVFAYETSITISGNIECHGSKDIMIPDIRWQMGQQEISVRPDADGEERVVGLDAVLDISMRLYEEEELEVITDIYGVTKEVNATVTEGSLKKLLAKMNGKMKVTDHIRIANKGASILQLLHSESDARLEDTQVTEDGLTLSGYLEVRVLYITGDDTMPYASVRSQIPYSYTLDIPGMRQEDRSDVSVSVEQLSVTMLDGEEMDVKAVLSFSTTVFQPIRLSLLSDITVEPLDTAKLGELPGMVIYLVRPGDNLWNIGKKYYLPVERLKALNELTEDEVRPGQKLLIVKGGV